MQNSNKNSDAGKLALKAQKYKQIEISNKNLKKKKKIQITHKTT